MLHDFSRPFGLLVLASSILGGACAGPTGRLETISRNAPADEATPDSGERPRRDARSAGGADGPAARDGAGPTEPTDGAAVVTAADGPPAAADDPEPLHAPHAPLGVGHYHICVLDPTGTPVCKGRPAGGPKERNRLFPYPEDIRGIYIVASHAQTCVIRPGQETPRMGCWGHTRTSGQDRYAVPVDPVEIALGDNHGCVRERSGEVLCWPGNAPPAGLRARRIAAAGIGTCAVRAEDGGVVCWGNNVPEIPAGTRAIDLALGGRRSGPPFYGQVCVTTPERKIACYGEVGSEAPPQDIVPRQLVAGDRFGCALLEGGTIRCWGAIAKPPAAKAKGLRAVANTACAVTLDDAPACWGYNADDAAFAVEEVRMLVPTPSPSTP